MNKRRSQAGGTDNLRKVFNIWLNQHLLALEASLAQIRRNLTGNLFSIAVIGISLALPAGFYLLLDNVQRVMENWDGTIQIALYLKPEISDERAASIREELASRKVIEQITLITRQQALEDYKKLSGFGEALDAMGENPLPSLLLIQPHAEVLSTGQGEALLAELGAMPEVESAQYDRQWVKRFIAILHILKRGVIILSTLLSVAVLLIIGNTIRLSIINRRAEIAINKLFGATNAYIQRPFLYSGLIFGLAGSLIAWGLLLLTTFIMRNPVDQLALLYNSDFRLQGLNPVEFIVLLMAGGGLGLFGSWIAVGRHIRDTEPT